MTKTTKIEDFMASFSKEVREDKNMSFEELRDIFDRLYEEQATSKCYCNVDDFSKLFRKGDKEVLREEMENLMMDVEEEFLDRVAHRLLRHPFFSLYDERALATYLENDPSIPRHLIWILTYDRMVENVSDKTAKKYTFLLEERLQACDKKTSAKRFLDTTFKGDSKSAAYKTAEKELSDFIVEVCETVYQRMDNDEDDSESEYSDDSDDSDDDSDSDDDDSDDDCSDCGSDCSDCSDCGSVIETDDEE